MRAFARFCLCIALACVGGWAGADDAPAAAKVDCAAEAKQVQVLRDDLERAYRYALGTKDNFGAGRAVVIGKTEKAISLLTDPATGWNIAASPGTNDIHIATRHGHPRMHEAQRYLRDAKDALEEVRCLAPDTVAAIKEAIAQALRGVNDAFFYNPPYSGG
jgi:hypothetical protein